MGRVNELNGYEKSKALHSSFFSFLALKIVYKLASRRHHKKTKERAFFTNSSSHLTGSQGITSL